MPDDGAPDVVGQLRRAGHTSAADDIEAVREAEEALGVSTVQVKTLPLVRRAARLHANAAISTGRLIEVLLVAIHHGENADRVTLPDPGEALS